MAKKSKKTSDKNSKDTEAQEKGDLNRELNEMISAGTRRTNRLRGMNEAAVRSVYGDPNFDVKRTKDRKYPALATPHPAMMQDVAVLTSNNPTIATPPREGTDVEVAKSLGGVLRGLWTSVLKMRIKIILAVLDGHLSHCMVAKAFWDDYDHWDQDKADKTGDGWVGQIQCNIIKPDYFFCDDDIELATDIPTKAQYCGHARWMDKRAAAVRWPEYKKYLIDRGQMDKKGRLIGADVKSAGGGRSSGAGFTDETGFNKSTLAWKGRDKDRDNEAMQQRELADFTLGVDGRGRDWVGRTEGTMTRVEECYSFNFDSDERVPAVYEDSKVGKGNAEHIFLKDAQYFDSTKPIMSIDGTDTIVGYEIHTGKWPQEELKAAYDKPKYKNFKRVVVRLDREFIAVNDSWDYSVWPYIVTPLYILPHLWMGHNCAVLSRGYDKWMNRIGSNLTNYIENFGEPQFWVENGAMAKGKNNKKVKISNKPGKVLKFVRGGIERAKRVPPAQLPSALFNIFGLFRRSDQDSSGSQDISKGASSPGTQTKGEVQLKDRNAKQRVALKGAFLDEWLKQLAVVVSELMMKHYTVGDWVAWTGNDAESVDSAIKWTQELADAQFDVVLEATSTLPFDDEREEAKLIKANEIANNTLLPEVLKKLGVPNVKEVLARHPIHGLLVGLMEQAKEAGLGPDDVAAALRKQLDTLVELGEQAPAGTVGSTGSPQAGEAEGAELAGVAGPAT